MSQSTSDSTLPKPPSVDRQTSSHNPLPQNAPGIDCSSLICGDVCETFTYVYLSWILFWIGAAAAVGHTLENSIPLSIFPLQPDKFCIALCGVPGKIFVKICLLITCQGSMLFRSSTMIATIRQGQNPHFSSVGALFGLFSCNSSQGTSCS
jgi:hypothetical protein